MIKRICGSWLGFSLSTCVVFSQAQSVYPYHFGLEKDAPALALSKDFRHFSINFLETRQNEHGCDFLLQLTAGLGTEPMADSAPGAAKTGTWLLGGSILLPFTLMADANIRTDAGKVAVLHSESLLLANGLTLLTQRYVLNETRISTENPEARASLPYFSGHTPVAASLSFCSAKIWSEYHPDSKWKPFVWGAAVAVPAASGYFRYRAGEPISEVAAGYAIGALVGYFVPHFHKIDRRSKRKIRLSSSMVGGYPVFVVRCLW